MCLNLENYQRFKVEDGEGGVAICTLCTNRYMLTVVNGPFLFHLCKGDVFIRNSPNCILDCFTFMIAHVKLLYQLKFIPIWPNICFESKKELTLVLSMNRTDKEFSHKKKTACWIIFELGMNKCGGQWVAVGGSGWLILAMGGSGWL